MRRLLAVCAALAFSLVLGPAPASAETLTARFRASDAFGTEAPPTYGLRLDGVFGAQGDLTPVTFHFQDVFFDVFSDGSALLHGTITVAEAEGASAEELASAWSLNVQYQQTAGMGMGDPSWEYFHLVPLGNELVNQADPNDTIGLTEAPADGSMPFEMGVGVLPNDKCISTPPCLSAAGWVFWTHGNVSSAEGAVADFLMELDPQEVPEPVRLPLLALGLGLIALALGAPARRPVQTVRAAQISSPQ